MRKIENFVYNDTTLYLGLSVFLFYLAFGAILGDLFNSEL